jgi:hypothetical protein
MSLRKYIAEAKVQQNVPQSGDVFAIELEDGTLLETYIMSINSDTIVLDATPKMISVLREWADLEGEAGEVLFEGQFKQHMQDAAERMELDDFVERFGHMFSAGEAREFWMLTNDVEDDANLDETDYQTEIGIVDRGEYDQEGDMAKDDLATIIRAARKLTGMLDDNENMPEWVQSKINKAADYVDTAADYIESNKQQGVAEGNDHSLKKVWDRYAKHLQAGRGYHSDVRQIYKSGDILQNIRKYVKDHHGQKAVDDMERYAEKRQWDESVAEGMLDNPGEEDSPVAQAIIRRILLQRTDLLAKHGPERVGSAVDEVADFVGDVDEIGSSDVSGWVKHVEQMLGNMPDSMDEAKYQGREVALGKPTRGDVKKFKVYVKDPSTGNIKKVNFGHGGTSAKRLGQKTMKIKKSDPARRRSFRARHNCDNPGPRTKARYWSCRAW